MATFATLLWQEAIHLINYNKQLTLVSITMASTGLFFWKVIYFTIQLNYLSIALQKYTTLPAATAKPISFFIFL